MECRRGLAMRILSGLSAIAGMIDLLVILLNGWICLDGGLD